MARNVVLVTVDSFRADHCSFMGYERETTPTLDEMAEEGHVFTNAITPGPTTPESLPAIFTGEYPVRVGGTDGLAASQQRIREHVLSRDTIPQKLARRGYATAGFTPNPWTSQYFGFEKGFDHYEDFIGGDISSPIWDRMLEEKGSKPLAAARLLLSWIQRENVFKPWRAFYDDAVGWAQSAEEPYFLWVFLLDIHFPYLPGSKYRTQSRWREYEANLRLYLEDQHTPYSQRVHNQLVTAYDDAVRDTDAFLEQLRSDLDDAVIVVHGDHGEAFGEHGTYTHQHELYRENVHVPLVVSNVPDKQVSEPVSLRSIPELLTGIADTGTVPDVQDSFVLSKTSDAERTAIEGRTVKYIRDGSGDELFDLRQGEHATVSDDRLQVLCRQVLSQYDAVDREQQAISRAAKEVASNL